MNCWKAKESMAKVGRKSGFTLSEETKAKMRAAHLGKKYNMTPEGSAKLSRLMSERRKGMPPPVGMTGKHHTEATKARIGRANKGRVKSPEECQRISDGKKGRCSAAQLAACLRNFQRTGAYQGTYRSEKMRREFHYRSRPELNYLRLLDSDPAVEKFDYEPFFIRYNFEGQTHFYLPDFFVRRVDGFVLVEVKPRIFHSDPINQAKFSAARTLCEKKGWTFEVVTDEDIDSMLIGSQADRMGTVVGRKVQRLTGEESQPISPTRAPGAVVAAFLVLLIASHVVTGQEIVRHPGETWGSGINSPVQQQNEIMKEINYKIVRHIFTIAGAGNVIWDRTPPAGVPWIWHKESLYDALVQGSNLVFQRTQRVTPNWIVAGTNVCNVLEVLSGFNRTGPSTGITGIRKVGTLGDFTVYKDPSFGMDGGITTTNDFLMGFKGGSFLDTGYIWAPYLPLYVTGTIMLDDMIARKAMAQRSGLKVVNSNFYVTGSIVQTGGAFVP